MAVAVALAPAPATALAPNAVPALTKALPAPDTTVPIIPVPAAAVVPPIHVPTLTNR